MNDNSGTGPDGSVRVLLHDAAAVALANERMPGDVEIGLTFVDDEEMAALNEQYRGIDAATDVLSFPLFDRAEIARLRADPDAFPERPLLLGDVVISTATAARQADEYSHTYEREIAFLFVHGLLHLLGYDHDDEPSRRTMRQAEEAVLATVGVRR